jgi:hypothetical protein
MRFIRKERRGFACAGQFGSVPMEWPTGGCGGLHRFEQGRLHREQAERERQALIQRLFDEVRTVEHAGHFDGRRRQNLAGSMARSR